MGAQRILDRARHRAQRCLVQHDVDVAARLAACAWIGDIRFDETVAAPARHPHARLDLVEVPAIAGRKIVEADDALIETEQGFDEVRADEAGAAGDEPAQRTLAQLRRDARERIGVRHRDRHSRHTASPRARSASASARHLTSTTMPPGSSLATWSMVQSANARCATAITTA